MNSSSPTASSSLAGNPAPAAREGRWDKVLLLMLAAALVLRVIFAWLGGQMWFPDESRYYASQNAWVALRTHKLPEFYQLIFSRGDHLGFKLLMIPIAILQERWGWSFAPAAILGSGIFSVGSIALIYGLARRMGAERAEARWCAFFACCMNMLFYWSRNTLPYDMALCCGLACLYVGLHPRPRWYHSLFAGFLGFACFVIYNGYWLTAAFALTVHVLRAWPPWREWKSFLTRGLLGAVGLYVPFLLMVQWAASIGLHLYESYFDFAATINQGDFDGAERTMAEYLWASEGLFFTLWVAAIGWLLWNAFIRTKRNPLRAWIWLGGVLGLSLTMIIFCNVLQQFVVYGRLIRQLAPFLALLSGWAVNQWTALAPSRRRWRPVLVTAAVALAAYNFHFAFRSAYDFSETAAKYRDAYRQRSGDSEATRLPLDRFVIVDNAFLWPGPPPPLDRPHEVLLSSPHPMRFRPYLFESYTRDVRAAIERADVDSHLFLLKN